jgi:hypothetical protein
MPRQRHYSPEISRFLVSVLYHEAKRRKIPMTRLTNNLLTQQLSETESWQTAQNLKIAEDPPTAA